MDAFCDLLSDKIRNRLRGKNTEPAIIPSVMISQLQPLDLPMNKSFKHLP
jgi:hypothetical protein